MNFAGIWERRGRTLSRPGDEGFHRCFIDGLSQDPKVLPCKYFYDAIGSDLFDRICELPEYYQTRTELKLLKDHAGEIASLLGPNAELIEFGAGALRKVRVLIEALDGIHAYVPVDISGEYLKAVTATLERDYPALLVEPVVGDFTNPVNLPLSGSRRIGFFPGSTIGNFRRQDALALLSSWSEMLAGGGLLIGVDLVKNPAVLHAAYNDAAGVTAAFNKNLLARANRELDANFDLDAFAHHACYNPMAQRIEMYLISLKRQRARAAGRSFAFEEGEAIHTEDSHKYTVRQFRALAAEAGFVPRAVWVDAGALFSLHWLEAPG
jgi:dimethylhistidine N-methyltransferase